MADRIVLSVLIDKEDQRALQHLLPWGTKNVIFSMIAKDLVAALKQDRSTVLGKLLTRAIKIYDHADLEVESGLRNLKTGCQLDDTGAANGALAGDQDVSKDVKAGDETESSLKTIGLES